MTQEDKELLLKDLCARLLCGVKISLNTDGIQNIGVLDALYPNDECIIVDHLEKRFPLKNGYGTVDYGRFSLEESNFKPYLRPMSSMTEEERKEWYATFDSVYDLVPGGDPYNEDDYDDNWHEEPGIESFDWLNAHHFDFRGLIDKGLALEAPKNMY